MIHMSEIFDFISSFVPNADSDLHRSQRLFLMGYNILKSNHIIDLRLQHTPRKILIFSLCLSGKDPFGKPHTITIEIIKENRGISAHCSCIAGTDGQCKHTVASLLKLERMDAEDVSEATCTDLPQNWGKVGKSAHHLFEPVPVQQFCHFPKRKRQSVWPGDELLTDEILSNVKNILFEGSPACSLKRLCGYPKTSLDLNNPAQELQNCASMPDFLRAHLCEYSDDVLSTLMNRIKVNGVIQYLQNDGELNEFYFLHVHTLREDVERIYTTTTQQNNLIWKKEREVRITGTKAYDLKTKKEEIDWNVRCERVVFNTFKGNSATQWGKSRESYALRCFSKTYPEHQLITDAGLCVNTNAPMLAYSPDAIVNEDTLLEVKCPTQGKYFQGNELCDKLKYLLKDGDQYKLKRVHRYFAQIQLGLAILNFKTAYLIIYSAVKDSLSKEEKEDFVKIEVTRDDLWMDEFLPILIERYFKYLLPFLQKNERRLLVGKL